MGLLVFEQKDNEDNIPAASSELRMAEAEERSNNPWTCLPHDVKEVRKDKT